MATLRTISLALLSLIGLVSCQDYGEFTVAERTVLDPAETPALEDMNLLNINVDFRVFGEAHYQWVPDRVWPRDVREYIRDARLRFDDEWNPINELPKDFSLGLPKGCLLVQPVDQGSWFAKQSNYKRLSLNDREVTLISYPTPASDERPSWSVGPPHLAVFEVGKPEPAVLEIGSYSYEFEAFVHQDEIVLILNAEDRLLYRTLRWSEDRPQFSDPIELFQMIKNPDYARAGIRKMVSTKVDDTIHLAWIVKDATTSIYHRVIDPSQPGVSQSTLVTDTDSSLLTINAHADSIWLHWIDGRFGRDGFMPTNTRKWFSAEFSRSGRLMETLVINTPFDNSDWAYSPVFAWSHDSYEVLAWGALSPGSIRNIDNMSYMDNPIQLALLDTKTHVVSLAQNMLSHEEIVHEAQRQYTAHLRNHPVHGLSPEQAEECDRWIDWLRKRREMPANMNPRLNIVEPNH